MHPRASPLRKTGIPRASPSSRSACLAVAPVEVRARHDHRPLRLGEQGQCAGEVGHRRRAAARRAPRRRASSASMNTWSSGKSTNAGPECGRDRGRPRLVDQRRDLGGRARGRGEAGERAHERDVVDLLQRALAPAHRRRPPAEHEHRRVVLQRRAERAHPVGHAGTGRQRGDARRPGDLRPSLGGERGARLVAHIDDVDALLAAAVVDREQVAARQREELRDPVGGESAGDQAAPVQLRRAFGVRAHRPDPIDTSRSAVEGACTTAPARAP